MKLLFKITGVLPADTKANPPQPPKQITMRVVGQSTESKRAGTVAEDKFLAANPGAILAATQNLGSIDIE